MRFLQIINNGKVISCSSPHSAPLPEASSHSGASPSRSKRGHFWVDCKTRSKLYFQLKLVCMTRLSIANSIPPDGECSATIREAEQTPGEVSAPLQDSAWTATFVTSTFGAATHPTLTAAMDLSRMLSSEHRGEAAYSPPKRARLDAGGSHAGRSSTETPYGELQRALHQALDSNAAGLTTTDKLELALAVLRARQLEADLVRARDSIKSIVARASPAPVTLHARVPAAASAGLPVGVALDASARLLLTPTAGDPAALLLMLEVHAFSAQPPLPDANGRAVDPAYMTAGAAAAAPTPAQMGAPTAMAPGPRHVGSLQGHTQAGFPQQGGMHVRMEQQGQARLHQPGALPSSSMAQGGAPQQ